MSADAKPRWITVTEAADYPWPGRSAITSYPPGEYFVKAEVADYLVLTKGKAKEGKADGSEARSTKGKRPRRAKATKPVESVKPAVDAGADTGHDAGVGGANLAADDSAGAGQPLADSSD
jgi:hypothetical protein